ncbi:MAG: hypothetical protein Q4C34_09715 [Bacteroidales bacterium]|nr:hypothetical protein [Bacteroidales bacterium]
MKKFYTLALAAAVALSASAADRQTAAGNCQRTAKMGNAEVKTVTLKQTPAKAPAKKVATSAADVAALDLWSYYGLLNNQDGEQTENVQIMIDDAETGAATVVLSDEFELAATLDASAGTLSIEKQLVGEDEDGPIYFYLKDLTSDGDLTDGESKTTTAVGTFNGKEIVFDEDLVWALGDPSNERVGWYVLSALNVFGKDSFVSLGDAQFKQNLFYAIFTGSDATGFETVEVKTDGTGIYKVIDPLKNLYAALNLKGESPELVLDATDPTNVSFEITSSGIREQTYGVLYYFSESYYSELTGEALDPALKITMTKEDDQVTITFPVNCTTIYAPDASKFFYGANAESVLTFTERTNAVDNINVDNSNAPVEFFNLQGVRVANPENGVYIRRQGSNATKVFVK